MHKILSRSFVRSLFVIPGLAAAALIGAPAQAQEKDGDKVSQLIVYGDDPCPQGSDDEIVVCARLDESERYRIPEMFRNDPNKPSEQAWTNRVVALERAGAFGTDSCSPAGMGGFTGCTRNIINRAYAEKRQTDKVDWAKLTADERQKRLDRIDAEAAAEEARFQAEEARKKAEQAAPK